MLAWLLLQSSFFRKSVFFCCTNRKPPAVTDWLIGTRTFNLRAWIIIDRKGDPINPWSFSSWERFPSPKILRALFLMDVKNKSGGGFGETFRLTRQITNPADKTMRVFTLHSFCFISVWDHKVANRRNYLRRRGKVQSGLSVSRWRARRRRDASSTPRRLVFPESLRCVRN